ncbi:pirin family protein [Stenotrophomonas maltophilia]|uniref:pirin family protein n=1 Tax=Stenotrophomonas maltophilia TaxID=40324 RepID=UPI002A9CC580|nr:pirin family protein [Stenotrophomonas maltophilia]
MPLYAPLQRANHGSHFRALGLRGSASLINPFIGVDHAWMSAPTFPPHPHSGISAVSYVFLDSETGIENRDSIGTHNLIQPGGIHWTKAGRGIIHEEIPAETGKTVHSLQIFVDLPRHERLSEPQAMFLEPQEIPVIQEGLSKVRVAAGSFRGEASPLQAPTPVTMLDVSLDEGAELSIPLPPGEVAFILPIHGSGWVDSQPFDASQLQVPVFNALNVHRDIRLNAPTGSNKLVFFSGRPLLPVAT